MIIIDFLYYYLVLWFEKVGKKINPYSRTSFVLGVSSLIWFITIDGIFEYALFNTTHLRTPKIVPIIIGIAIAYFLDYIYVKKKRYDLILKRDDPKFNISDKWGKIISLSFFAFTFLIFFMAAIIIHAIK
jgi:hypothetical protein